jgi:hypothetical protein
VCFFVFCVNFLGGRCLIFGRVTFSERKNYMSPLVLFRGKFFLVLLLYFVTKSFFHTNRKQEEIVMGVEI